MIFPSVFLFFILSGQASTQDDVKGCLQGDIVACSEQQILHGLGWFFDRQSVRDLEEVSRTVRDWGSDAALKRTEEDASDVKNASSGEGRSHRRTVKRLLPVLLALKIQYIAIIGGFAYLAVLLIAKLALLKGSLALGLGLVAVLRLLNSPLLRTELQVHTNGGYETVGVPEQHLNNYLPQNHFRRQKNMMHFKSQSHPERA